MFTMVCSRGRTTRAGRSYTHNPKVAGSNPAPATMNDEGLADADAANPFRLPSPDFTRLSRRNRMAHPSRRRALARSWLTTPGAWPKVSPLRPSTVPDAHPLTQEVEHEHREAR